MTRRIPSPIVRDPMPLSMAGVDVDYRIGRVAYLVAGILLGVLIAVGVH